MGLFVELVRVSGTLFEGVDEEEIMDKFLNNEEAYKTLSRLLNLDYDAKKVA